MDNGILNEDGTVTYAPYRLHYGRKYVINASEQKYRECGYYPIQYVDMPDAELKENEYYKNVYAYADGENGQYIQGTYEIETIEGE